MSHTPTMEQQAIIDAYLTDADLTVEAGAGTGKTSTLKMLAAATPDRSGVYLAYNKAIQLDAARTFPHSVVCKTAHALAFAAVARPYAHRLKAPRVPAKETARILGINEAVRISDSLAPLAPQQLARIVAATTERFCHSADVELTRWHVPRLSGLDKTAQAVLGQAIEPWARKAWDDIVNPQGRLRFTHDCYLKIWQLSRPQLGADFVLLDEAQDANPAVADIVERQQSQRILVGDRCQPPGTLVTVVRGSHKPGKNGTGYPTPVEQVPIEQLHKGDVVVSYDVAKAYLRRSGSPIVGITASRFMGSLVKVSTAAGQVSRYTPDHHCIAHIAPALKDKYVLYVMRRGCDYRTGITRGVAESQGNRPGFILRARQEDADAVWVLDTFDTREEAAAAEAIASWTYRVPELTFVASNKSVMTQETLDCVWAKVGANQAEAAQLLAAYRRDLRHPLWERGDDALLTRRATVVKAANLMDGMTVLTMDGATAADGKRAARNLWTAITVSLEYYEGPVYSMTVAGDHTYVGDGIITHNCQSIYGWRGAVDAMAGFSGQRLYLSQSFRFGQAIADEANKWLTVLDAILRLTGNPAIDSKVDTVAAPDAILCRSNAGAFARVVESLAAGRRTALVGGGADIKRMAEAADRLQHGQPCDHPELLAFSTWGEVQDYAENDTAGSDLKVFVTLVDKLGADEIVRVCDRLAEERYAETVVSTAHKAKGREWSTVHISNDFREPVPDPNTGERPEISREDAMLAYVAITRARHVLDRDGLAWIDTYTNPAGPAVAPSKAKACHCMLCDEAARDSWPAPLPVGAK